MVRVIVAVDTLALVAGVATLTFVVGSVVGWFGYMAADWWWEKRQKRGLVVEMYRGQEAARERRFVAGIEDSGVDAGVGRDVLLPSARPEFDWGSED